MEEILDGRADPRKRNARIEGKIRDSVLRRWVWAFLVAWQDSEARAELVRWLPSVITHRDPEWFTRQDSDDAIVDLSCVERMLEAEHGAEVFEELPLELLRAWTERVEAIAGVDPLEATSEYERAAAATRGRR